MNGLVGQRRFWAPQKVWVSVVAAVPGWVFVMPDQRGRPFAIAHGVWLHLEADAADLVSRIRARPNDAPMPAEHLLDEAADKIEVLQADAEKLQERIDRLESDAEDVRYANE